MFLFVGIASLEILLVNKKDSLIDTSVEGNIVYNYKRENSVSEIDA
jgi:hypothetical protein